MSSSLVLITCASGKQNAHLIPHLYSDPTFKLRLVVNSASSHEKLSAKYPDAEVIKADLGDASSVRSLMSNVTHVYHVGPSFHPHETEVGYHMIDAAVTETKQSGSNFKHFIYSSVLNTQLRKLLNHDCKRYVEEYLMESGLKWTILQPTHFVDNLPIKMLAQQDDPVFPAAWNPNLAYSFLALRDLGEAGAKVLREGEKHYMGQYPICSTVPISYTDTMAIFSKVIGKSIKIKKLEYGEAVEKYMKLIGGDKDTLQRMLLYYDNKGLQGNPNVLEWLLERKPTSLEQWAKITLASD